MTAALSTQPTADHLRFYGTWAYNQPDDVLHAERHAQHWRLANAQAEAATATETETRFQHVDALAFIVAIDDELSRRQRIGLTYPSSPRGFDRAFLDDLRARFRVEEVIARDVIDFQRSGRIWRGRCPLHPDDTPSLVAWPESQRWRCFGACAAGG